MNDYLAPELRDGFYVDTNRKKIWKVELDLLNELQSVCSKYNLKCFANGGTLLGAIRHNGFIPWDDDLDVAMTRKDFNILCQIGDKEFKNPYFLQTALSDRSYFIGIARLRKSNTTGIISFFSEKVYNNGIYIDIYVYDKIPDDEKQLKKKIREVKIYNALLDNYYDFNNTTGNKLLSYFKPFFSLTKHFISYERLYELYVNSCSEYNNKEEYSTLGFLCMPYFIKYIETIEGVNNLTEHKFEYTTILVPADYDNMLSSAYGDYMQFPPVEKRGTWHDGVITFDPDVSFLEYYKQHHDKYSKVLKAYRDKGII